MDFVWMQYQGVSYHLLGPIADRQAKRCLIVKIVSSDFESKHHTVSHLNSTFKRSAENLHQNHWQSCRLESRNLP